MKKSELSQLIREEIKNIVGEVRSTTIQKSPNTEVEKKVAMFLNAMAKNYDYPVEDAIMATIASIKALGYANLVK